MIELNPKIDDYLVKGCGRCALYDTPDCKVHSWHAELVELRRILLESGLTEELKWSQPCYTVEGKNILLMTAWKDVCALDFFKGVLLKDPHNILIQQTKNIQASRQLRYTDVDTILEQEALIKAYVQEAIEIEKAGLQVKYKDTSDFDMPDELQDKFDDDPAFKRAFEALTPGRQRGYLLHFSGAKQSKTRVSRIEKCVPKIFEGKGFHDR